MKSCSTDRLHAPKLKRCFILDTSRYRTSFCMKTYNVFQTVAILHTEHQCFLRFSKSYWILCGSTKWVEEEEAIQRPVQRSLPEHRVSDYRNTMGTRWENIQHVVSFPPHLTLLNILISNPERQEQWRLHKPSQAIPERQWRWILYKLQTYSFQILPKVSQLLLSIFLMDICSYVHATF